VELPVVGEIAGMRVRGIIDLLDTSGRIIDVKTPARKPSRIKTPQGEQYEVSPDYRFQVATYRRIEPRASGVARVDTLVKTKVPALVEQEITIDAGNFAATEKLYPLVQRGIFGRPSSCSLLPLPDLVRGSLYKLRILPCLLRIRTGYGSRLPSALGKK
jgi:hypothetical protein